MRKRLLFGLILLSAALAGLYQWRIQLITGALNRALEKSDIALVDLKGLDIGWNSLEIGELLLTVGEGKAPQLLQQVQLEYSLIDLHPQRLTVSNASLTVPTTSMPAADLNASAELLFTGLAEQCSGKLTFFNSTG